MFVSAIKLTAVQILIILGPGLLLTFLMNFVAGDVEKKARMLMGRKKYLWIFGWLGTTVHELGHALMCLVFRHKIHKLVLFNPDPNSQTLGYVEHSHNPKNPYHVIGNFFIGIGPILLGTGIIYLSSFFLLSENFFYYSRDLSIDYKILLDIDVLQNFIGDTFELFHRFSIDTFSIDVLGDWRIYVFFYLLFCIGSSMKLSASDIKCATKGFAVIVLLLYIANLAIAYFEFEDSFFELSTVTTFLSIFHAAMLFALLLNVILIIVLSLIIRISSIVK